MPDLPVAAPDHATRIAEALAQHEAIIGGRHETAKLMAPHGLSTWLPAVAKEDLDALLAERRQDKERIERLTEKLELLTSAASERASLSDKATSSENPVVRREATRIRVAFVDAVDDARAALAVEEDAENG